MAPSTAVLIDGTALYFRSREARAERLDFEALASFLEKRSSPDLVELVVFFSTFDDANEAQQKFLTFLRTRLRWDVELRPIWEADPLPRDAPWERSARRNEFVRFDAAISFAIGRLVDRYKRIVVVTDSFGVEQPIAAARALEHAQLVLAFFRHSLDPRWHTRLLTGSRGGVEFWDLDEVPALFGRDPPEASVSSALRRIG